MPIFRFLRLSKGCYTPFLPQRISLSLERLASPRFVMP